MLLLVTTAFAAHTWSVDGVPDSMTPEAFQAEVAAGVAMWTLPESECGDVPFFDAEPVESGGELQVVVVDGPTTARCDDSGCVLELDGAAPWGADAAAVAAECVDVYPTRIAVGRAAGLTLGAEIFGRGEVITSADEMYALMYWLFPCREGMTANAEDLERLAYPEPVPTFGLSESELRLDEGEILTLEVQGPPIHDVQWFVDSEPLGTGEEMRFGPIEESVLARAEVRYAHKLCGDMDKTLELQLLPPYDVPKLSEPGFGIPEEEGCATAPAGAPWVFGVGALGLLLLRRRAREGAVTWVEGGH